MGRDGERNPLGLGARGRGAGACCGRVHGDAREDEEGGAPLRHAGGECAGLRGLTLEGLWGDRFRRHWGLNGARGGIATSFIH